jgi:hypothetical protein
MLLQPGYISADGCFAHFDPAMVGVGCCVCGDGCLRGFKKAGDIIGKILTAQTTCDLTRKLLAKIARARDQLLTFMDAPHGLVEPTNNACERALRPAVIARKVTNGFCSVWAAEADAAVRSVVDTKALTGIGTYSAIRAVVNA